MRALRGLGSAGRIALRVLARPSLLGDYLALGLRVTRASGPAGLVDRLSRRRPPERPTLGYADWIAAYDTLSDGDRRAIAAAVERMDRRPSISILTPVYDTPEPVLRRCIESVRAQLYPDWELCLVDDASPQPHVAEICRAYVAQDPRIRFVRRETNGHIAAASDTALELAAGEWAALLDHDDELPPQALYQVAELLARRPDLDLVFTDEDKIDLHGRRFDPWFKGAWDPELMLAQNAVLHLAVLRTALMREVGGFRSGFDGSQDHDLLLRIGEATAPERIAHLPFVLYHWRAIAGSAAATSGEKTYAYDNARRAIQDHLDRAGEGGVAELGRAPGRYRVRRPLPDPAPRAAIVLDADLRARKALGAATDYPDFEIVPTLEETEAEVFAFLDDGMVPVRPDWLAVLAAEAVRGSVGCVGPRILQADLTLEDAGVAIGPDGLPYPLHRGVSAEDPGYFGRADCAQQVTALGGGCLVVRRSVFEQVGGFERGLGSGFAAVDLAMKVRAAGYSVVWTPHAELRRTRRPRPVDGTQAAAFQARWSGGVDPFRNPNLAFSDGGFALASPPAVDPPWRNGRKVSAPLR